MCACIEPPSRSALSISLAFVLYGLVTLFLSFVPLGFVEGVALLSPLLCCALIVIALKGRLEKIPCGRASLRRDLDTPSRMLLGVMLACCVICAVVDVMVPESSDPSLYSFNAFWPVLYAVIFGVFFVWFVLMKKKDPDALWPMFTFVLSVGLFGFSSFFFIDTFVAGQFMRASADCIIVFAWVVVACVVYRKNFNRFFISVFQSLSIQTRPRFRKPPLMLCFRRLILVPAAWLLLRSHLLWRLPLSGAPSFFPQ